MEAVNVRLVAEGGQLTLPLTPWGRRTWPACRSCRAGRKQRLSAEQFRREAGRFSASSSSVGGGRRVIVIGDNAKHHHAWREPYAAHFALDFLPPCNPEIGPDQAGVEAHAPTNRYFQTLEDVIAAVEEQ